jgi:hypothetical protein
MSCSRTIWTSARCSPSPGPAVRASCRYEPQNVMPADIGQMVVRALTAHAAALEAGALVTLDELAARVRILPIH